MYNTIKLHQKYIHYSVSTSESNKSHFFFLSWVHLGQNLRDLKRGEKKRCEGPEDKNGYRVWVKLLKSFTIFLWVSWRDQHKQSGTTQSDTKRIEKKHQ